MQKRGLEAAFLEILLQSEHAMVRARSRLGVVQSRLHEMLLAKNSDLLVWMTRVARSNREENWYDNARRRTLQAGVERALVARLHLSGVTPGKRVELTIRRKTSSASPRRNGHAR